jgi:hypothetical protein
MNKKKYLLALIVCVLILPIAVVLSACSGGGGSTTVVGPTVPIMVADGTYLVDVDNSYRETNGNRQTIRQFENLTSSNTYNFRYNFRIEASWLSTNMTNWFYLMGQHWGTVGQYGGNDGLWFEADIDDNAEIQIANETLSTIAGSMGNVSGLVFKYINGRFIVECTSSANVFMHLEFSK